MGEVRDGTPQVQIIKIMAATQRYHLCWLDSMKKDPPTIEYSPEKKREKIILS